MARSAKQLREALRNAKTMPVQPLPGVSAEQARSDRAETVADLQRQLSQREAEESGSWNGSD